MTPSHGIQTERRHEALARRPSKSTNDSLAHTSDPESYPSTGYAWFVVGLLTLAYVFSFIDRQILNLMVKPIQKDLGISDTGMGLLMGASFAVFYTFFGIPLGRLADTRSRRLIICCGIAVWSLMTAGCGLTKKFWQLALMRMGVGVGEASLSPAAYSLISDYFRPELRSTAISVYSMGIYIGSGLAFILGGLVIGFTSEQESFVVPIVGAVRSWQLVFFVVGLPGLLVAVLMLAIREPARKGLRSSKRGVGPVEGVAQRSLVLLRRESVDALIPQSGHWHGHIVQLRRRVLDPRFPGTPI